jgi:hypothetical protein
MNITEREQDSLTIFVLDGRVDSDGAVELDQALQTATSKGKCHMILDMSAVRYYTRNQRTPPIRRIIMSFQDKARSNRASLKHAVHSCQLAGIAVVKSSGFLRLISCTGVC